MKMIIGALALAISAPLAAQNTPADPHAGHAQHQAQQQPENEHEGHATNGERKMSCCDNMKPDAQKECCAACGQEHSGQHESDSGAAK